MPAPAAEREIVCDLHQAPRSIFFDFEHVGFFKRFAALLLKFKTDAPPLADVLLPDDNPHVVAAAQRINGSSHAASQFQSGTIDTHRAAWRDIGMRWSGDSKVERGDKDSIFFRTAAGSRERCLVVPSAQDSITGSCPYARSCSDVERCDDRPKHRSSGMRRIRPKHDVGGPDDHNEV